ncbi:hypothetical protein GXW71_15380 [Roseomonas hellenica]|uniref:Uncharacterized protein n=1 Tax=Plastoroseomonas hellenica TaxID=2687306 RepID=A0ABS5EZM1_9PROT|nr:hypothetical protein [Plastoroseomonas hellenica]MBR0665739.1 hypothetical protein [Plastoroseomonas hellenica]
MRAARLALVVLALALPAQAQEPRAIALRMGTHAGFGRLVFDLPASGTAYRAEVQGDRLLLRFDAPPPALPGANRLPRNILGLAMDGDAVVVTAAAGARLRHFRLGERVVVDAENAPAAAERPVRSPSTPAAATQQPAEAPRQQEARREPRRGEPRRRDSRRDEPPQQEARPQEARQQEARQQEARQQEARQQEAGPQEQRQQEARRTASPPRPSPPPSESVRSDPRPAPAAAPTAAPTAAPPVAAPVAPVSVEALPSGAETRTSAAVPGAVPARVVAPGRAVALAFPDGTGVAVFRRGGAVLAVFDAKAPLDLTALRGDPVFGAADSWTLPDGVVLRLPMAAGGGLLPRREGATWVLEAMRVEAPSRRPGISAEPEPGPPARLVIATEGSGRALALQDPETGMPLLVATLAVPGQGFAAARRMPDLELLPTQQGAAVLARSDRLVLRSLSDRILLTAAPGDTLRFGTPGGLEPVAEAAALTRVFDLPTLPPAVLQDRLRDQQAAIAGAAPLARGPLRREAMETLLALGMPQEAQAMAGLALQEDPRVRGDARLLLGQGVAALLAGRVADARGIEDRRLPATDETALWRGLLAAARGEMDAAASGIVPALPLLMVYPEAVRQRLLPLVADALAEADPRAAQRLLAALPDDASFGYARARVAEAEGRAEDALTRYDAVAQGVDRLRRARALRRATELRLATGRIDAAGAAGALERAVFAWRGDAEELATRRRIAALRRQTGAARQAFDLLRETAVMFPDQAAALAPDIAGSFAEALISDPPVSAVALFDAHRDLLPRGPEGAEALAGLAGRLVELDLPDRAAALFQEAADRATTRAGRAGFGARLAALRLAERDAAAALTVLDATGFDGLPAPLVVERGVLRARALAMRSERQAAEALLVSLGDAGFAPLAALRADVQDWAGAAEALSRHLTASLPPAPAALDDAQRRDATRLAAFAALAGDDARLAVLKDSLKPRMGEGPLAEAFGLLTSDPLRGIADLARLQRELDLMRALPGRLAARRAD